jgi:hypothetical protein
MRPALLVFLGALVFVIAIGVTLYVQQFLTSTVEKLSLWLIVSEVLGFGGLILAEAYVFLWNIRVLTFGSMSLLRKP